MEKLTLEELRDRLLEEVAPISSTVKVIVNNDGGYPSVFITSSDVSFGIIEAQDIFRFADRYGVLAIVTSIYENREDKKDFFTPAIRLFYSKYNV